MKTGYVQSSNVSIQENRNELFYHLRQNTFFDLSFNLSDRILAFLRLIGDLFYTKLDNLCSGMIRSDARWLPMNVYKGLVNIYGNTGPGNLE